MSNERPYEVTVIEHAADGTTKELVAGDAVRSCSPSAPTVSGNEPLTPSASTSAPTIGPER